MNIFSYTLLTIPVLFTSLQGFIIREISIKKYYELVMESSDGEQIGRAELRIEKNIDHANTTGLLDLLEINHAFQNQGFGRLFFAQSMAFLQDQGVSITSWVASPVGNEHDSFIERNKRLQQLIKFYTSLGALPTTKNPKGQDFLFFNQEDEVMVPLRKCIEDKKGLATVIKINPELTRGFIAFEVAKTTHDDAPALCTGTARLSCRNTDPIEPLEIEAIEDLEFCTKATEPQEIIRAIKAHYKCPATK